MKVLLLWPSLVLCMSLCLAVDTGAQPGVGALAIDEQQDDQYGWVVDYETTAAAQAAALRECGPRCSVKLTFERCGAYAADQDADSTAVGWAESYDSAAGAWQAALAACRSRGGSGCTVRVWGCNGQVVEERLRLDRATQRQIQQGLRAEGFDPGGAAGLFGARTRAAIRGWQAARGARPTGYLDGAAAAALRSAAASGPVAAAVAPPASPAGTPAAGTRVGGAGSPTAGAGVSGSRRAGVAAPVVEAGADAGPRPGDIFQDCDVCPEMVVLPDGGLALGRYEVLVGEYRAFAAATGSGAVGHCVIGDSWQEPRFPQTDRHPVTCVNWNDAQAYVSWLSRTARATYRLPTEEEWERAAAGSVAGCVNRDVDAGTCPVGSSGANRVGLFDMVGNLSEWTENCWEGDCGLRVLRGGSWVNIDESLGPGVRSWYVADHRYGFNGFRVARTLD